jgi:hypothetical protein
MYTSYWANYQGPGQSGGRCDATSFVVVDTSGNTGNFYGPPSPKVFLCPGDPSGPKVGINNAYAGGSILPGKMPAINYAANYQLFQTGGAAIPASTTDGASTTVMLYERYGFSCDGTSIGMPWHGSIPSMDTFGAILYADGQGQSGGLWKLFQPQPPFGSSLCDIFTAQGIHFPGTNVLLGDASVKLVSPKVSQATWHAAVTPAANDTVGYDF